MRVGIVASGAAAALLLLAACSGGEPAASMPDVTGERLDVAYSDLNSIGVGKNNVEIVGGGTFGVVDESNWLVCEQRPAAGAAPEAVRLVVDRSCPDTAAQEGGSGAGSSTAAAAPAASFAMPSLVGMVLQDAQDVLQSNGSYLLDQQDATGMGRLQALDSNWQVCTQDPAPGATVSADAMVTLGAVKLNESCPGAAAQDGAPADSTDGSFAMPEVVGMVLQDAQDLLQSQGSYVMDQQDATGQGRFQMLDSNWKVCAQDPPAGGSVSAETVVTLSSVKLAESCP